MSTVCVGAKPAYLSTREAATYTGLKPKTIYYLVKIGKLKAYVVPTGGKRKTLRFRVEDLDRMMKGGVIT
jgi:excisionase family DNA binding protein